MVLNKPYKDPNFMSSESYVNFTCIYINNNKFWLQGEGEGEIRTSDFQPKRRGPQPM